MNLFVKSSIKNIFITYKIMLIISLFISSLLGNCHFLLDLYSLQILKRKRILSSKQKKIRNK
jgi:hypothetical protein